MTFYNQPRSSFYNEPERIRSFKDVMTINSQSPIRVLVVDDNFVVRMGLTVFIETFDDLELVGEAEDGRQAVDLTDKLDPDVIIMDLRMPDFDGVSAIRAIIEKHPHKKILVLTSSVDPDQIEEALDAGASGLLPKTITIDVLAKAIHDLQ
jgi:two-component system, NarL family, response regulator LiaR